MTSEAKWTPEGFYGEQAGLGDYLHLFNYSGRRVTRQDVDYDLWHDWQSELNAKLQHAIAFMYGGFVQGARRVVVDGIEPVDRPHDSIQFNLFEYVYHQIIRKDPEWVARDLFRQSYRSVSQLASENRYDEQSISCLLLYTAHQVMLDEMISRPLDEGDVISNANTLILMGKVRDGNKVGRALHIAKHRGSACDESIVPFQIGQNGLELLS